MKPERKKTLLDFLMFAALFKQDIEKQLSSIWGVPYWQIKFYSTVCMKIGRVLEKYKREKRQ